MSSNPPRKHHFAPVFYLGEWTGEDGELEQFSRPFGPEVKARRLPPSATGFAEDLYAMPGLPAHLTQQVETLFMQKVDDLAAVELARMTAGGLPTTRAQRSAWTRFMQSLQLRTPADIVGIKTRARDDWAATVPEIQTAYEALRREGDPETFEAYMTRGNPELVEQIAMRLATRLIDDPKLGERINNMVWDVLDLSGSDLDLMTSDLGVERILGLGDRRAFMTLPIGPRLLFIAANDPKSIANLRAQPPRKIVQLRNRSAISLARTYVWATDRRQEAFVRKHFGTVSALTLGERLGASGGQ